MALVRKSREGGLTSRLKFTTSTCGPSARAVVAPTSESVISRPSAASTPSISRCPPLRRGVLRTPACRAFTRRGEACLARACHAKNRAESDRSQRFMPRLPCHTVEHRSLAAPQSHPIGEAAFRHVGLAPERTIYPHSNIRTKATGVPSTQTSSIVVRVSADCGSHSPTAGRFGGSTDVRETPATRRVGFTRQPSRALV